MFAHDYVEWSVKFVYYVGGVASTIAGSWISSKIRLYHDARNSHRDDLKRHVLEPIRGSLPSYGAPRFWVSYQAQGYNSQAAASDSPITYGPSISVEPFDLANTDDALLLDARTHHYTDALAAWDQLKLTWAKESIRHKAFIEAIAQEILTGSGLPAFPTSTGPYVMHWNLGVFVYGRLLAGTEARLAVEPQPDGQIPDCRILKEGNVYVARGSKAQIDNLLGWVDAELTGRRPPTEELRSGLRNLEEQRRALDRQLSLAIAEKKLRRRCSLVTFF